MGATVASDVDARPVALPRVSCWQLRAHRWNGEAATPPAIPATRSDLTLRRTLASGPRIDAGNFCGTGDQTLQRPTTDARTSSKFLANFPSFLSSLPYLLSSFPSFLSRFSKDSFGGFVGSQRVTKRKKPFLRDSKFFGLAVTRFRQVVVV